MHKDASWVLVEPNLPPWTHERVTMVAGMFDDGFVWPAHVAPVDAVVHSHTFEHVYDPRTFLQTVAQFLTDGQKHCFSIPRLDAWLRRSYSNALNFEHTVLLTEGIVDELLRITGFRVVEKRYFEADHSVFYATERVSAPSVTEPFHVQEYVQNRALFSKYIDEQRAAVQRLNKRLQESASGDVYLFGAHVFSQFLIGFGLDVSRVIGILDNDPSKHGKRLYGTPFHVKGIDALRASSEPPIVVLRAGAYRNEIRDAILCRCPSARVIE
jgi:hypothetical protein